VDKLCVNLGYGRLTDEQIVCRVLGTVSECEEENNEKTMCSEASELLSSSISGRIRQYNPV